MHGYCNIYIWDFLFIWVYHATSLFLDWCKFPLLWYVHFYTLRMVRTEHLENKLLPLYFFLAKSLHAMLGLRDKTHDVLEHTSNHMLTKEVADACTTWFLENKQ